MRNFSIKELAQGYERIKTRLRQHSSLQITDNREIIADGCSKIVTCDDNVVIIEQIRSRVTITGSGLKMRNWGTDGVTITGEISSVEFTKGA